jgi:xanthine dehydrogenase accessory factor
MKPRTWQQAIAYCEQQGCAYVIATIIGRAGSAPRDPGSKMIITADEQFDTGGESRAMLWR